MKLWHHWDRPRLVWYQGGHVSFLMEPAVRALLEEVLDARAMLETSRAPLPDPVAPPPAPLRPPPPMPASLAAQA